VQAEHKHKRWIYFFAQHHSGIAEYLQFFIVFYAAISRGMDASRNKVRAVKGLEIKR